MDDSDVKKIVNHINLMHSYVGEHGTDVFRELVKTDPKKAVEQLPAHIERVLGMGNGFFSGIGCGGAYEGVTAPMLDAIGSIYPCLERELRKKALENCLGFLDGQNYFVSQNNVALINEPWLVGDILANRALYNCGFNQYHDKIKQSANWHEFNNVFTKDGKLDVKSVFWLCYAVSFRKYCPKQIRDAFAEQYPDLIDRTKDAIAGIVHSRGLSYEPPKTYKRTVADLLNRFDPDWRADLRDKIKNKNFIILEKTISDIENRKKWKEAQEKESKAKS